MRRFPHTLLLAALLVNAAVHAAGLPDTGQDTCYTDTAADGVAAASAASIARDAGTYPRQDCRYGRDPAAAASALPKTGTGVKGFDYTRIANNGTELAAGATLGTAAADWACTRDNVTGLTWEVKTVSPTDPRSSAHTYTWYNSDTATNAGNAGSTGSNTCNATLPGGLCNTQAFVAAVNAAALCTYIDWRLPSARELFTLAVIDGSGTAIDTAYFPNTSVASGYWAASPYAANADFAWAVSFRRGNPTTGTKAATPGYYTRLVRGGKF